MILPEKQEVFKMVSLLLAIIYIAFISLGLPDALLGAAWPVMHLELGAPLSYAGIISFIIAGGTVVSSLLSDRLTRRLGTGGVTVISVGLTALALFGFSTSQALWMLCLWAVPYGLGAGSVDAALNNYVALHYESRHMSWLHCFWGVGASVGPYIMGYTLAGSLGWQGGYRIISLLQVFLTAALLLSIPLWKKPQGEESERGGKPLSLARIVRIPGAKAVMLCFFCYCAIEQTAGLWAASYLSLYKGVDPETAASFASMFYLGITIGRGLSGFLTIKLSDEKMVRLGFLIIALGLAAMLLPLGAVVSLAGLLLIGLGCAPVYPCLIHSTPAHFGADKSQTIIGVQMASAYVGTCLMPSLFGILAQAVSVSVLPVYLTVLLLIMSTMHTLLVKKAGAPVLP